MCPYEALEQATDHYFLPGGADLPRLLNPQGQSRNESEHIKEIMCPYEVLEQATDHYLLPASSVVSPSL